MISGGSTDIVLAIVIALSLSLSLPLFIVVVANGFGLRLYRMSALTPLTALSAKALYI